MRAVLLVALLASAPLAAAQPTALVGTVFDEDGAPLAGVSVYLAGTSRGDATDADGRYRIEAVTPGAYQLVGSMVGFEPASAEVEVGPGATVATDLTLYPALRTVGLVRVEAPRDLRWQEDLAQFEAAFLGESSRADSVRILNPEALEFRRQAGALLAKAGRPLVLENRALGYRVTYDLEQFVRTPTEVRYEGTERFEPLAPGSAAEAARWAAARVAAYRGSQRHLIRALLGGTAEREGFRFVLDEEATSGFNTDILLRPSGSGRPTAGRRLVDRDGERARLAFRGRLEVRYPEPEDPAFLGSEWARDGRSRPADEQTSTLELRDGSVAVTPDGRVAEPLSLLARGYLGFERLADLLPADYSLPPRD